MSNPTFADLLGLSDPDTEPVLIPTFSDSNYSQIVGLDGTDYTLTLLYNQRNTSYSLTIGDSDGDPIVESIPIVADYNLLENYQYVAGLPPGILVALASGLPDPPPDIGELAIEGRVTLAYFPAL